MWSRICAIFLLLSLTSVCAVSAQRTVSVTGMVIDAETEAPVVDAHVFIGRTTRGAVTDARGHFIIQGVPPGTHRLYATRLGYRTEFAEVVLTTGSSPTFLFRLTQAPVELPEITVVDRTSRRWARQLRQFERLLIGESVTAQHVSLVNPQTLDFSASVGRMTAVAGEPLVIENRALGYRLTYNLTHFHHTGSILRYDGDPFFEELEAADAQEAERWAAARRDAYLGSLRHFLHALAEGSAREEGFATYMLPSRGDIGYESRRASINPGRLLHRDDAGGLGLEFGHVLEVVYLHAAETPDYVRWARLSANDIGRARRGWLILNERPARFDSDGVFVEPFSVTQYGYFAYTRLAEELPRDYRLLP
jgi:hypothetical protein